MKIHNITIKLLKTFKAVAICKNHTKAANELNLTQSAVTKQIKQFEEILGLQLFFYKNKQLYLTNTAMSLLPKTEKALSCVEDISYTIQNHTNNSIKGSINLGITYSAQDQVFDLLEMFSNSFKEIDINLTFSDYNGVIKKLMHQEIDIGFVGALIENVPVENIEYSSHKLYMIAPKDCRHLSIKSLDITELAKEKKILNEKGSFSRMIMESLFTEIELSNSFEVNNNYTTANAVANGFGIALVPKSVITENIKHKIQILDIKQLPIASTLNLINLKERKLSKVEQIFKDYARDNSLIQKVA